MSEYKIKEEEVYQIRASKQSDSRKDLFDYQLRRVNDGWAIYYEHYNVDQGMVSLNKIFLPDDIIDILTTYHAKEKLKD